MERTITYTLHTIGAEIPIVPLMTLRQIAEAQKLSKELLKKIEANKAKKE